MNEPVSPTHTDRPSRLAHFFSRLQRAKDVLQRHWWVLPLTVLLAVAVQVYRIWDTPPSFISIGRMIVNIRIQIPTGAVYSEELSNFLGTQIALMQSDSVRSRAAERVRTLRPDLTPSPVRLDVAASPKTTIFNLKASGLEPDYTRAYLDSCMETYINLKKEMRSSTSETTLAGITEELVRLEKELRKGEEELLGFQSSNSVVLLQEQGGSVSSYLVLLNRKLAELKTEYELLKLLNLEQTLERQRRAASGTAAAAVNETEDASSRLLPSGADYLLAKQQIQLLKAEQQELSQYLRPKHPKMIALSEEIARKERLLDIFRQQSQDQLANRRNSLELQIQNLERDTREWDVKALDVSRRMAEYQRIHANNNRVKSLYDRLIATMQTVGVGRDIDPETVTILERASVSLTDRPNVPKALLIGLLVGLAAGLVILLVIDRLDDRLASFTELQDAFDEPVLGQVPHSEVIAKEGGLRLIQPDDDRHAFVEAYRNLRSSLLYMSSEGKRAKTIIVTSAIPNEGKSLTAANLAITLAEAGSRVLLIDADLRRGALHKHFHVPPAPGLSDVLRNGLATSEAGLQPANAGIPPARNPDTPSAGTPAPTGNGWTAAVVATHVPNLFLLPLGRVTRSPGEMFLSPATAALLQAAAGQYDFVVLDSAPVMAADDVTSLAPQLEGVLFVIRASYTSARAARAALDLLYQREVNVLGLVFNSVQARASEYYLYKYKDYYASYPGGQ